MEHLIREIEAYCSAVGTTPRLFLRGVIGARWDQWQKWKDGVSSPTMITVDRLREYMAAHPPKMSSPE